MISATMISAIPVLTVGPYCKVWTYEAGAIWKRPAARFLCVIGYFNGRTWAERPHPWPAEHG